MLDWDVRVQVVRALGCPTVLVDGDGRSGYRNTDITLRCQSSGCQTGMSEHKLSEHWDVREFWLTEMEDQAVEVLT